MSELNLFSIGKMLRHINVFVGGGQSLFADTRKFDRNRDNGVREAGGSVLARSSEFFQ